MRPVIEWFDLGGTLNLGDAVPAKELVDHARRVQGLIELAHRAGIAPDAPAPMLAAGIDFVLEGLYSQKKIGRTEEGGYHGSEPARRRETPQGRTPVLTPDDDDADAQPGRKKKRYYN